MNLERKPMKQLSVISFAALLGLAMASASAKLPVPVLDDAGKAKAAEAAAKTAHGGKVANFQLCKSMDRTAAAYFAKAKTDGKTVKPADAAPACVDPGPFVYTAAPAAAPAAAGAAPVTKK